jgi:DNA (cytosine-5)-methyltransferase 1
MLKVGSDFSGVGAFNQALKRLGVEYKEVFACDKDKFARQTFVANYGEPESFPNDVYQRVIPEDSLDIYMTSPPCQSFSLAGKRLGKNDPRGVLFFNSLEFIEKNKPRFFIFENVKGLLSDNSGATFNEWLDYLGGKSVNGTVNMFPFAGSVPYHIYWQVLNAKDYGVPQNRERVFIIGIRDDKDNSFRFPKTVPLTKRLKDVLEGSVDGKYYLSDKMINVLTHHKNPIIKNENPEKSACIHSCYFKMGGRDQQYIKDGHGLHVQGPKVVCFGRSEAEKERRREHFKATGKDSGSFKDKELILKDTDCYDTIIASPNPQKEGLIYSESRVRRLTPTECFRLMDFPDSLVENARNVGISDSQLYKQAGNSIVVGVLYNILKNLKV